MLQCSYSTKTRLGRLCSRFAAAWITLGFAVPGTKENPASPATR